MGFCFFFFKQERAREDGSSRWDFVYRWLVLLAYRVLYFKRGIGNVAANKIHSCFLLLLLVPEQVAQAMFGRQYEYK